MNIVPWITVALVSIALTTPVQGDHGCNGTVTALGIGDAMLYVDDRSDRAGELHHYVYLESNEVEGLQSGGHHLIFEGGLVLEWPDPCGHRDHDDWIF